jgi:hypothetical protein
VNYPIEVTIFLFYSTGQRKMFLQPKELRSKEFMTKIYVVDNDIFWKHEISRHAFRIFLLLSPVLTCLRNLQPWAISIIKPYISSNTLKFSNLYFVYLGHFSVRDARLSLLPAFMSGSNTELVTGQIDVFVFSSVCLSECPYVVYYISQLPLSRF